MNFNTKSVIAAGAVAALATTGAVVPTASAQSAVTEGSSFFGWANSDVEIEVVDNAAVNLSPDVEAALVEALRDPDTQITIENEEGAEVPLDTVVSVGENGELVWEADGTYAFGGLEVYIDGSATEGQFGSSTGDVEPASQDDIEACTNAALSVAIPAALLVPLTLATQVDIPGLSPVANEIRQSIQDANTQLQQGAGIFSDEAAAAAEEFNLAIAGVDYNLAEALAGAAAILAGIGGAYYLYDQCAPVTGSSLDGGGSSGWLEGESTTTAPTTTTTTSTQETTTSTSAEETSTEETSATEEPTESETTEPAPTTTPAP